MSNKIIRDSLLPTTAYLRQRDEWRKTLIPFKKLRTVHIGKHATLIFENELTVRYQLQEMIRVDKSLENDPLEDELSIYNGLIPSQNFLKATLMFEFVDSGMREVKLKQMIGVENHIWLQIDGLPKIYAQPSNALGDNDTTRASSVYFVAFEIDEESRQAFLKGEAMGVGIDHPAYDYSVEEIAPEAQAVLMEDLK